MIFRCLWTFQTVPHTDSDVPMKGDLRSLVREKLKNPSALKELETHFVTWIASVQTGFQRFSEAIII